MTKRNSKGQFVKGERNNQWKGGRHGDGQGYIVVYRPDHPHNNKNYVLEHRLVMEKAIGRYLLRGEVVHHVNGIKNDNRIENLVLLTRQVHPSRDHFLGVPKSEELKKKISKTLMGHKVSKETREKISKTLLSKRKS